MSGSTKTIGSVRFAGPKIGLGSVRQLASRVLETQAGWMVATIALLTLQAALTLRHEAWLDEWQAVQLAVQSPDLPTLLAQLRYEGHPPLWYLLLRGTAAVFGAHDALRLAALACALATQIMVLRYAPFPRWARVLLCLSEIVLFEYNTIARGFTLGLTLTIAALVLWRRPRLVWIPLALLPAVDFLFGIFSLIFVAQRWATRDLDKAGTAAWALVSLASAISIVPVPGMAVSLPPSGDILADAGLFLHKLGMVVLPLQWPDVPRWNEGAPFGLQAWLWVPFLLFCRSQTQGRPADRLALVLFLSVQLAMCLWVYALPLRHVMQVAILIIALQWRRSDQLREASGIDARSVTLPLAFSAWLSVMAACGLATAAIAFSRPFDTAPRAALTIENLGLSQANWVADPAYAAQGLSALTGIQFETLNQGCTQDFIRRDFSSHIRDQASLADALQARLQTGGRFYLVSTREIDLPGLAEPLATIPPGFDGYGYLLYEVGQGREMQEVDLPRCVPGMRPFPAGVLR